MASDLSGLFTLLKRGVSPYHAAAYAEERLQAAGFSRLSAGEPWTVQPGGSYYCVAYRTLVAAFRVSGTFAPGQGVRIAASHLDWPCFYIKPAPEQDAAGCLKLNVEPYGGMIRNTWLDRPLSAAGLVSVRNAGERLVDFATSVLTIPNVAIHLNREVNKGVELNPAKDMQPVCASLQKDMEKEGFLQKRLADKLGVAAEDVLGYDLCLYNPEEPAVVGFDGAFVSSPRLDNLTSVHACLEGIIQEKPETGVAMAVLFDHEEIGSGTKQGADSSVLSMLLEKLALALGLDRAAYLDMRFNGFMLSCDVAHAVHPNHVELYDSSCQSLLNRGVSLKMNYEQRYATEAVGLSRIERLCSENGIPYQRFMNRADLRGGGTLGSYASSQLGMRVVDIGVPMLAMHSCRETMGARDQEAIDALVARYFAG